MSIEQILKEGFEDIDQVVFMAHEKLDSSRIGVKRKLERALNDFNYILDLEINKKNVEYLVSNFEHTYKFYTLAKIFESLEESNFSDQEIYHYLIRVKDVAFGTPIIDKTTSQQLENIFLHMLYDKSRLLSIAYIKGLF